MTPTTSSQYYEKILDAISKVVPLGLSFAAAQLGLGNVPASLQKGLGYVPKKVDTQLRAVIGKLAGSVSGKTGGGTKPGPASGNMAPVYSFSYQRQKYNLAVTQSGGTVVVKIIETTAGSTFTAVVTPASLNNVAKPKSDLDAVENAAKLLLMATRPSTGPSTSKNPLPSLQTLQSKLNTAEEALVKDITGNMAYACTLLNAGCFAAGTLMLTKGGWVPVEDVFPGDWVLSRDESDATGVGEWKQVEARFERTGRVLHLHLSAGELIRTTLEHPFWVAEKGWTPAGELHAGDRLGTLEGDWVTVGELYDTGEYEKVYNCRVADWHTYFVGGEGCAVWAHNAYTFTVQSGIKYNYSTGSYQKVTNQSGYNATWWVPANTTPPPLAPCPDNISKLGDKLTAAAQTLADGWTGQTKDARYGSYFTAIGKALDIVNGFLAPAQQLTLDQIDQQGDRFPTLAASNPAYNSAVANFWYQRSVAIGAYIHTKLDVQFRGTAGLTYYTSSTPGPDFKYISDTGRVVYFEVLPDTKSGLEAHSIRSMNKYLYRAVFYNRNAINDPGSQEPGAEVPDLGNS